MAKNFEANAYSIFAGSYERFLFGHAYGGPNSSFVTAAGEEEFEKRNAKFLCTIDAHSQSIKSIAAAGPFFCSGGHDDRIRAFHVNKRGEISDVGSLTGHSGTVTCIAFAKPSIYGKREEDDDDGKKCTTKNNNNNNRGGKSAVADSNAFRERRRDDFSLANVRF